MSYSEGPITEQTIQVYEQLRAGKCTVNAIAAEINRGRGTVAHRIAQLIHAGCVRVERTLAGGTKLYQIDESKPAPILHQHIGPSFAALEAAMPLPFRLPSGKPRVIESRYE